MRILLPLIALLLLTSSLAWADGGAPRKLAQATGKPMGKPAAKAAPAAVNETDVLEFVREHHPELADLLNQLKENRPKEYQKAVRDLSRVRERLHAMRKNDDQRYQLELSVWKAETRIQLLAARLKMGDQPELRDQLRQALGEQMDLRLAVLRHEREMAKQRIAKLDAQIERLDKERSQAIDKQLQALTRAADAPARPGKKAAEPKPTKKP
jgi:hypothetical protein